MIMKRINVCVFIILFFINISYAQNEKPRGFTLDCKLTSDYSGYIYLQYENKTDSCLIVKNNVSFKGELENDVVEATFYIKRKRITFPGLFLENSKIDIELTIEERINKADSLTILTITSAKGTK